ncbi:POGO family transposase, putative [Ixodes scapularis]|uniref:POGO family transposase, putative n=1 Tax=Ixodes scapularis TaxID=6945 RepID=B7QIF3_IXOSC|nr:POGO family transposase, putative [Ixodes scapularis]|eukprot:XP_002414960.1 POGO family transposase, putative [Ixodes scapularis]
MGKHLNSYTAGFKLKAVASALEHGKRAAGRRYDVDEKCVWHWCDQKDGLASTNKTRHAFHAKPRKFPNLENKLFSYVEEVRNDGKRVPAEEFPRGIIARAQEKRRMDEELVADWLKNVRGNRSGAMLVNKSLLELDSFCSHLTEKVKVELHKKHTDLAVIPGGLTGMLQPLRVSVNRPFKVEFFRCCTKWMASENHQTPTGRLKIASLSTVAGYIATAWNSVPLNIAPKSFRVTRISKNLDGTEDDLVWECVSEEPDSGAADSLSDEE